MARGSAVEVGARGSETPQAGATRPRRPTSSRAALQAAKSFWPRFSSQLRHAFRSSGPILFRLALHRRCIRVLHLKPIGRATRAVRRALALGHYALKPELAGMAKDDLAVPLDVLIPPQARPVLSHRAALATVPAGLSQRSAGRQVLASYDGTRSYAPHSGTLCKAASEPWDA